MKTRAVSDVSKNSTLGGNASQNSTFGRRRNNIGRRTGLDVKAGKVIRTDKRGLELFEDYWSESEAELTVNLEKQLKTIKQPVKKTRRGTDASLTYGSSLRVRSNIGRRTGLDVKAGKTIRKGAGGLEVFDDYWTESEAESTATVQISVEKTSASEKGTDASLTYGSSLRVRSNIGRRTGLDVKAGKTIRKGAGGLEVFDDYWTESEAESTATVQISVEKTSASEKATNGDNNEEETAENTTLVEEQNDPEHETDPEDSPNNIRTTPQPLKNPANASKKILTRVSEEPSSDLPGEELRENSTPVLPPVKHSGSKKSKLSNKKSKSAFTPSSDNLEENTSPVKQSVRNSVSRSKKSEFPKGKQGSKVRSAENSESDITTNDKMCKSSSEKIVQQKRKELITPNSVNLPRVKAKKGAKSTEISDIESETDFQNDILLKSKRKKGRQDSEASPSERYDSNLKDSNQGEKMTDIELDNVTKSKGRKGSNKTTHMSAAGTMIQTDEKTVPKPKTKAVSNDVHANEAVASSSHNESEANFRVKRHSRSGSRKKTKSADNFGTQNNQDSDKDNPQKGTKSIVENSHCTTPGKETGAKVTSKKGGKASGKRSNSRGRPKKKASEKRLVQSKQKAVLSPRKKSLLQNADNVTSDVTESQTDDNNDNNDRNEELRLQLSDCTENDTFGTAMQHQVVPQVIVSQSHVPHNKRSPQNLTGPARAMGNLTQTLSQPKSSRHTTLNIAGEATGSLTKSTIALEDLTSNTSLKSFNTRKRLTYSAGDALSEDIGSYLLTSTQSQSLKSLPGETTNGTDLFQGSNVENDKVVSQHQSDSAFEKDGTHDSQGPNPVSKTKKVKAGKKKESGKANSADRKRTTVSRVRTRSETRGNYTQSDGPKMQKKRRKSVSPMLSKLKPPAKDMMSTECGTSKLTASQIDSTDIVKANTVETQKTFELHLNNDLSTSKAVSHSVKNKRAVAGKLAKLKNLKPKDELLKQLKKARNRLNETVPSGSDTDSETNGRFISLCRPHDEIITETNGVLFEKNNDKLTVKHMPKKSQNGQISKLLLDTEIVSVAATQSEMTTDKLKSDLVKSSTEFVQKNDMNKSNASVAEVETETNANHEEIDNDENDFIVILDEPKRPVRTSLVFDKMAKKRKSSVQSQHVAETSVENRKEVIDISSLSLSSEESENVFPIHPPKANKKVKSKNSDFTKTTPYVPLQKLPNNFTDEVQVKVKQSRTKGKKLSVESLPFVRLSQEDDNIKVQPLSSETKRDKPKRARSKQPSVTKDHVDDVINRVASGTVISLATEDITSDTHRSADSTVESQKTPKSALKRQSTENILSTPASYSSNTTEGVMSGDVTPANSLHPSMREVSMEDFDHSSAGQTPRPMLYPASGPSIRPKRRRTSDIENDDLGEDYDDLENDNDLDLEDEGDDGDLNDDDMILEDEVDYNTQQNREVPANSFSHNNSLSCATPKSTPHKEKQAKKKRSNKRVTISSFIFPSPRSKRSLSATPATLRKSILKTLNSTGRSRVQTPIVSIGVEPVHIWEVSSTDTPHLPRVKHITATKINSTVESKKTPKSALKRQSKENILSTPDSYSSNTTEGVMSGDVTPANSLHPSMREVSMEDFDHSSAGQTPRPMLYPASGPSIRPKRRRTSDIENDDLGEDYDDLENDNDLDLEDDDEGDDVNDDDLILEDEVDYNTQQNREVPANSFSHNNSLSCATPKSTPHKEKQAKKKRSNKRVTISSFILPSPRSKRSLSATPATLRKSILKTPNSTGRSRAQTPVGSIGAEPVHIWEVSSTDTPHLPRVKHITATKIIRPEPAPDGVRRSRRTRLKPLQWYKNERAVYGRRKSGGFAIVDVSEPFQEKKKKGNHLEQKLCQIKRKQAMEIKQRRLSIHVPEPEDIDLTEGGDVIVRDADSPEKVICRSCIRTQPSFQYWGPGGLDVEAHDPYILCKFFQENTFAAGELVIRPLEEKPTQLVAGSTMVFNILEGKLAVTIHETTSILQSRDVFYIPPENTYSIRNLRKTSAKLFFTQVKGQGQ